MGNNWSKLLSMLCLCLYFSVSAQDTTKVVKINTRYTTEQMINRNMQPVLIDTGSNGIEIFNNMYRNNIVFQDLGNFGTPARPLLFRLERPVGFRLSDNPFEGYWIKPEDTRFYNTKTPYTDLFYAQGSNEMLVLRAKHAQNVLPRWNLGADFQRITSIGFLARQYTSIYNYQFFSRYVSKNRRYDMLAHVTWNRGLVEESGGVQRDSAFEALSGPNKKVLPALLNSQTRFKSRAAYLKQYWHLGRSEKTGADGDTVYNLRSNAQISYSIKAEEISYIFENNGDTNSLLLPHQYYDVTENTFDSLYNGKIENRLGFDLYNDLESQATDSTRRYLGAAVSHTYNNVSQISYVRNYQNVLAELWLERTSMKRVAFAFRGYGAFNVSGLNAGDYKLRGYYSYRFKPFEVAAEAMDQLYRPDQVFMLFKSNQFIWTHAFAQTHATQLGFYASTRAFRNNFRFAAKSYLVQNWVYANTAGEPQQEKGSISITTLELGKTFQLWKFFFEHELIYQQSSSDVIRLPEFSGRIRYYFQSRFKRMKFQVGVDAWYNTAYYANNYNPATRLFFLQNERRIGNYPVFDPFAMGEIKRAAFFFKYEHVNQDWFASNGFYSTPHYPLSLASFRMGLRWRFYD